MANPFKKQSAVTPAAVTLPVVSGFSDSSALTGLIISEAVGLELANLPLDRNAAIQIGAITRGVGLLTSALSQLPMVAMNADGPITDQPSFLYRSDAGVSPQERIARTVDSLCYYGHALWAVKRGSKQTGQAYAPILDAAWVSHDRWTVSNGQILVDGNVVDETEVIYINGYTEGLLKTAATVIRGEIALRAAWMSRAANPIPLAMIEHDPIAPNQRGQLIPAEVQTLRSDFISSRRDTDGALGYMPPGLKLNTYGTISSDMFESAFNANRIDFANHLHVPASMLDGSLSDSSLTYTTSEGNANRFTTESLPLYYGPIQDALSQDSVVPRGQRVRFDFTQILNAPGNPTGAPEED